MAQIKTLAERAFEKGIIVRPTDFMPNGCGPAAGGKISALLVPDELADVDYSGCCDLHDLSYHRGGFLGLFYRKPRADVGLGACMVESFYKAAGARWRRGTWSGRAKAAGTAVLGILVGPLYTLAVLGLGWTPLTWRWRRRPLPGRSDLRKIARLVAARKAVAELDRSTKQRLEKLEDNG